MHYVVIPNPNPNPNQMHYVVIDLKTEHVGHSIRPYLYLGLHAGIYSFDEFEYKEIEIEDGMESPLQP